MTDDTRARAVAEEKYKSACVGQHMTADEYAAFDAGWDAAAEEVARRITAETIVCVNGVPYFNPEKATDIVLALVADAVAQAVKERDAIIAGRADMLNTCQQTIREQAEEIARLKEIKRKEISEVVSQAQDAIEAAVAAHHCACCWNRTTFGLAIAPPKGAPNE